MKLRLLIAVGTALILLVACKKDTVTEETPDPPVLPAYVIKSATYTQSSLSVVYKYVYSFNAKAQVTERQYFFPATAATSSSLLTFSYDDKGKLISTKNTSPGNTNTNEEEYIYDQQDRLVTRKTFFNGNPSGTSTYTYNGNTVIEEYAGLVTYTATLNDKGNIIKKLAEFANDATQNYTDEWLDYDDKPIVNEFPPSAGHLHSLNNFYKTKLTFEDWNKQAYNAAYDYQYTFNADGYVTESRQYDPVSGELVSTITYELIKP